MCKILLLHGYLQNGDMIRKCFEKLLTKTFIKNSGVELIAPHGPLKIENEKRKNSCGWWFLGSAKLFVQPHKYENIEAAIQVVNEELKNHQPDIVIGFSQGAVLATILLGAEIIDCKKVFLLSGSDIVDVDHHPKHKIRTTSIHWTGQRDDLVLGDESRKLGKRFENTEFHCHKWGHVIPKDNLLKQQLIDTVKQINQ